MVAEAFAPAKVNLTLHVTARRADGYHDLDSLVVFADVGDRVRAAPGKGLTLGIDGPMAAGLTAGPDNLVLRAARHLGVDEAALTLTKYLPVASGIGGGSSDAAAAIRALCDLKEVPLPEAPSLSVLGADVPVCLRPGPQRMRGLGEVLDPVAGLPPFWLVLANPRVEVPTPAVFRALKNRNGAPMPTPLPRFPDLPTLVGFVASQRNDLEAPALKLAPVIGDVLSALSAMKGCGLARMSGSGATCFGLFASAAEAEAARVRLAEAEPGWWVAAAGHLPTA